MKKPIHVIGVPFALGGKMTGPALAPDALINHGLLSHLQSESKDVRYIDTKRSSDNQGMFTSTPVLEGDIYSVKAVCEVTRTAGAHVFAAHRVGALPLIIGGDHSVSLGTLPQFLDPTFSFRRKVGLLWIDAHFDAHTPKTSHSHFANGLPFASALGHGEPKLGCYTYAPRGNRKRRMRFRPVYTLHIGAGESDCEPEEEALLLKLGVERITMLDIRHKGVVAFLNPLEQFLARVDDLILTVDLDAIQKDFAPAVSFQSERGLLPSQLSMMSNLIARSGKLRQIEIMEYNPDFELYTRSGSPITANLVFSLLGQLLVQKNPL